MTTEWMDIAQDAQAAAGLCLRDRRYRSSISRAYYASFSAVTAALHKAGIAAPQGRNAWAHAVLPKLIRDHLAGRLGRHKTRELNRLIRENYRSRLIADYTSGISSSREAARRCLTNAASIVRECRKLL